MEKKIANTILEQIGNKAQMMIGVTTKLAMDNGLMFSHKVAGAKTNKFLIELDGDDTYHVAGYKQRGMDAKLIGEHYGVLASQLVDVISNTSGLKCAL